MAVEKIFNLLPFIFSNPSVSKLQYLVVIVKYVLESHA